MIEVYEFVRADGAVFGCGTSLELSYWQSEGVMDATDKLGKVIGYEPPSKDERRKAAWMLEAA